MNRFPFFNSPYNSYRNYYNYYKAHQNLINHSNSCPPENSNVQVPTNDIKQEHQQPNSKNKKRTSKNTSFGPIYFNPDSFSNTEESILEILGISLYLDDLIILGLLFFLYNEGVKDDILFGVLLLLLLC